MSKHAEEKAEIASKSNDDMAALILKHAEEKAEFESNSNTEKATLISKHAEEKANLESKSTIEMAELTSRLGQQKVAIVLAFVERREAIESDYQDLAKLYDAMKVQLGMANKDKNRVFALEKENALSKDRVKVARDDYAKLKLQKEPLEHRHQTLHSELATAREAAKVEKKKADGGIKRAREEVEATQQRNLSAQSLANDKLERAINAYNTSQEELASCKEELRKVSIAKATAEESLEVTKIDLQEAIEARNTSDTSAKQSKEELGESHDDLKTRDATIEENRMRIGNLESELQRTQGRLRYTTREANSQLDTAWRQADDLLGFFNDAYAEVARLREKMEVMVPRKDLEFAEEQFAELQTEHYRLEREFEKLQRQLVDVKKEISDCEVELDPDNNLEIPFETISGLQGELQSLEEANQTLQETNQTLEENMIQLNGSIDRLTLELEERDTKLETASETIKTSNEEQARLQEVFNERQRELQGAKAQAAEANDSLKDSESRSRKLASDNQELTDKVGSLESKLEEQRRSFAVNEAKLKGETVDAKEQILQLNAQLAALRLQLNPLPPLPRPSNASGSSSHSPSTYSPELGEDRLHPSSGPSTSQSPQMLPPAATTPTSLQTPAQNHSRRASSASEASTDAPSPGVGPSRDASLAPPPQDPNAPLEYDFLISGTPKTGQRSNQGPMEVIALMDARIEQWTAKTAPSHWSRLSNMNACVNRRVVGIKKKQQGTHEDPDDPKTACTTCVSWKIPCVMAYKGFRPVVLPLPASERAAGVTPADRAYYVKCTENRAGSVS
jgi:chromosome segregation ATPase